MHAQRLITFICASIGLIACFLPWTGGDLTGSNNAAYEFWWGWIAILQFITIIWISVSGNRKKTIPVGLARLSVFLASGFILLETLALILIMVMFPFGTALYGIYIALAMAIVTLVVPPMINAKGKILSPQASNLAEDFGNNADRTVQQIDHLSQQVREGWNQGKEPNDKKQE